MSLDTSRFIDQVKLKANLPTGRYSDQEILDVAYDILLSDVQPFLISLRQEFYVKKSNVAVVANTSSYPINSRALGISLRELKLIDSGSSIHNLRQMSPEDAEDSDTIALPTSFYFEGTNVVLYPTPNQAATLVQSYYQRVSKPVETSACAVITAIDVSTGIVTAAPPTTWTTSNAFDLISRNNGNDTLAKDLTATAVSTTTITFTLTDLPSSLAVGDYVALAGESPYIQVPDDAIPLVQQLVCVDLLEALGDANALQLAMGKADKLRGGLARVMGVRIEGESLKFKPQF